MAEVESLIAVVLVTIATSFSIMVLGANLGRLLNVASTFYAKARNVIYESGRR